MIHPPTDPETRFWSKVQKTDTCWIWIGATANGYGVIGRGGRGNGNINAHRLSYEIHYGPIPEGLHVCHKCDVRKCVRPDHLFLGTRSDNMQDSLNKGRYVHQSCPEKLARGDRNGARKHIKNMPRGEKHGRAKLTEDEVKTIRRLIDEGTSMESAARTYGVSAFTISALHKRITWKHVP